MTIIKSRRKFFKNVMKTMGLFLLATGNFSRFVYAMGSTSEPVKPGIHKMEGSVEINGLPAKIGDLIKPNDVISTGPKSKVIFSFDESSFLMQENTRLRIELETPSDSTKDKAVQVIRIMTGKVLSAFNPKKEKKIITKTAVVGVRGTAAYVEIEKHFIYFCLCYGSAEIKALSDPDNPRTHKASHHEYPYYIYDSTGKEAFVKAPMKNHTDKELEMLENLVGRRPPFSFGQGSDKTGY